MKKIVSFLTVMCLLLLAQASKAQCNACFTATPDSSMKSLYNFDATCSTPTFPGAAYEWIIDGLSFGGSWPFPYFSYGFMSPGAHVVELIVSDINGTCTDTLVSTINITATCDASFYSSLTGNSVYFYNNSLSGTASFTWDFGDGNTGSGPNPTHNYATAGSYNVCCTQTDTLGGGCINNYCSIVNTSNQNNNCFAYIDQDSMVNNTYYLSASSSSYNPNNYLFNWSVNGTVLQSSTSPFFTHTVINPVGDWVELSITDSTGSNPCSFSYDYLFPGGMQGGCYACFNYTPLNAAGDSILLDASCSTTSNSYIWTVGGATITTTTPYLVQTFTPGINLVVLSVTDTLNNICNSFTSYVYVTGPPCQSCLSISPIVGSTSDYNFNAACSGVPNSYYYNWFVDNNYVTSTQTPTFNYSFSQSGTYNVCVLSTDSFGNQCLQACSTLVVNTPVKTQFNICGNIYKFDINSPFGLYAPTSLSEAMVYLITLQPGGQLDAVDSVTTDANGGYCFYNKPIYDYRIKAALQSSSSSYTSNVPTYFQSSAMWFGANVVTLANSNLYGKDIYMLYGNNTGGPGFISGNVVQGANKPKRSGNSLDGLSVILMDATTSKPVAYAKTDIGGTYTFNNIPVGNYKVYGELLNKQSIPATINITNTNTSFSNVDLEVNKNVINPKGAGPTKVKDVAVLAVDIMPNPATDEFTINTPNKEASIVVTDITGKVVSTKSFDLKTTINCSTWSKGIYVINIKAGTTQKTEKLIVK